MKFLKPHHDDEVSVVDLLHQELETVEPQRPIGVMHASSLTNQRGFCPREVVLCKITGKKPYPVKVDTAMNVTFCEGKDKQARLNNHWLRSRMVGHWECRVCGYVHEFCRDPVKCQKCGGNRIDYKEVVFYHAATGAQGSVDGLLYVGKPKLRPIEFKIMAPDEWDKLKAPLAEHRARSKLYMELMINSTDPVRSKHIDTDRMHVVYCSRGYGKMDKAKKRISPFKEFIVQRDPKEADTYLRMAWAVTEAKKTEWTNVPEGICAAITDSRTHGCAVCKECFSGKFAPIIKWKS